MGGLGSATGGMVLGAVGSLALNALGAAFVAGTLVAARLFCPHPNPLMAGGIKTARRMSLADCFTAALAKLRHADLYTGDPEFKRVEREIRVVWI